MYEILLNTGQMSLILYLQSLLTRDWLILSLCLLVDIVSVYQSNNIL